MSIEFTVVSIGTLSSNPLWGESPGLRTPHATTTLVRDGGRVVLVDPSLPGQVLASRLFERTGLRPEAVTDVFCTTLRPTHRRGLEAFGRSRWLCSETELSSYASWLEALDESSERLTGEVAEAAAADRELLRRFEPAPDKLTDSIHLYPLAGPSAGHAGLLLADPRWTTLIAGDAAVTVAHVLAGRAWNGCADAEAALAGLTEILQLADLIVCGHDNFMICPTQWAGGPGGGPGAGL
jgi:hypothetical protein